MTPSQPSPRGRRKKNLLFFFLYELEKLYELYELRNPIPTFPQGELFPRGKEKEERNLLLLTLSIQKS